MSTYEEFMVILTVAILIVTILNHRNKKTPQPASVRGVFL